MDEHTKEPWHIGAMESGWVAIDGSNGEEVTGWLDPADARRIVACVNACAGIPTYHLVRENDQPNLLGEMIEHLTKQRDELLAALEFYADKTRYNGPNQSNDGCDKFTKDDEPYLIDVTRDGGNIAKAAIASVKGGAA